MGFKVEYTREKFAFLSLEGSQMMIEEANETWKTGKLTRPFGRGINFQIEVGDIKPIVKSLKGNSCKLFMEPRANWYRRGNTLMGRREFLVQDPDGYLLRFSQDIGTKDAE